MNERRTLWMTLAAAATVLIGATLIEPIASGVVSTAGPLADSVPSSHLSTELVSAIRACDIARAEDLFEQTPEAASAKVVLGLGAEHCDRFSEGLRILRAAEPDGELGDWRLYAIGLSSIELGQFPAAKGALDRLGSDYPDSPLRARAILASGELARERGDLASIIAIARREADSGLDLEASEALDVAAWQAASELADLEARTEAAKRLLVRHPLRAASLEVVEEFRAEDGSLDWMAFLEAPEMIARAESLLEVDLEDSAITTLEEVPAAARSPQWHLMLARALTSAQRGEEALAALDHLTGENPRQKSDIEWWRAMAALEASEPRPGRQRNSLQRKIMRDRAHAHLGAVVDLGVEDDRVKQALRIAFEDALENQRFDRALETLRRLKSLNATDTTGARQLWKLGWKQYTDRNYTGAIGYWTELSSLYPTSSYNRSGLYWSARAHELLGNRGRSQQLLHEVVDVPFTDFYRRHALRRLEQPLADSEAPASPSEPWPRDPLLFRAEKLADFGLDEAAGIEIDALVHRADPRAVSALRSRILADRGERRSSIIEIKKAFSLLGTPFQGMAPERASALYYPLAFGEIIERHARENGLDPDLVFAMIRQESAFDPSARSWAGARGLMQVMPATGKEIAGRLGLRYSRERLNDPGFSVQLGTNYYRKVRRMFDNDEELSLAGYNAGPYRIKRLWRQAGREAELDRFLETLHLSETRSYVKRVLLFADSYRRLYPEADPAVG